MQVITDVLQYLLSGNEVFVRVFMHFASNATKQAGTISYFINNEPVVVVVGVVVCVVVVVVVFAVVAIAAYFAVFFAVVVAAALAVVFIYFCIIITLGRINIQMQGFSSSSSQTELSKDDVGTIGDLVYEPVFFDETEDVVSRGGAAESDVQLSMCEDFISEIEADFFKCLSLRFVYCHGVSNLSASGLSRGFVFVARRGRVHPNFWLEHVILKVNAAQRNREKNLRT